MTNVNNQHYENTLNTFTIIIVNFIPTQVKLAHRKEKVKEKYQLYKMIQNKTETIQKHTETKYMYLNNS